MKVKNYIKYVNFKPVTLEGMYAGNEFILNNLKENIKNIIELEAPITLNTLKQRLREALNVKKISQKALDIILEDINKLNIVVTNNLYDEVYWTKSGVFMIDELRINSNRQIYDIPYQELKVLVYDLNLRKEELYRAILNYFGYEVLTEKARKYLEFVEDICYKN